MKTVEEVCDYLKERIEELSEEADRLEEEGLDDSALSTECTKQELEEILQHIESAT